MYMVSFFVCGFFSRGFGFFFFFSFPLIHVTEVISSVWLPYIADPSAAAKCRVISHLCIYINLLLRNLGDGRLA
jgi:hypothetical protein